MLDAAWAGPTPLAAAPRNHPLGPPLDALSYDHGRWGALTEVRVARGFRLDPSWHPTDGSPTRDGFVDVPALVGTQPGAEFSFDFVGRGVGLLITSGPDAGVVASSVDGGPWQSIDTFTVSSPSLHLPWAVMLADDLKPGRHTIRVRISPARNPKSLGHALRVQRLLLN
jgi:sialidase-1